MALSPMVRKKIGNNAVKGHKKLSWRVRGYLPYKEACELIDQLEKAGIVASIVPGGIGVHPFPRQKESVQDICKEFGVYASAGLTAHESSVIYGRKREF